MPKRRGCSSATIASSKTKCPQQCGHFLWLNTVPSGERSFGREWKRMQAFAKKSPASACAEPGSARSGAEVKGRLAFAKTSASMGFRRADWLKRGAKRTLVRERRTKAKMPHKTQRSVGCVRRSEDRRQKSPASACAESGRRPPGRESLGNKLPLAIYLWKKRRFSYFGSQHTLMPSVR